MMPSPQTQQWLIDLAEIIQAAEGDEAIFRRRAAKRSGMSMGGRVAPISIGETNCLLAIN